MFRNGTPDVILFAVTANVLIYTCAMFTGYAMAGVINEG